MNLNDLISDALAWRIRGEFIEMPELRLNLQQAQRLWSLDPTRCEAVLNAPADVEFLTRTTDGRFGLRGSQP